MCNWSWNSTVVNLFPLIQQYLIMATRLGKFELPNRLVKEEETANRSSENGHAPSVGEVERFFVQP